MIAIKKNLREESCNNLDRRLMKCPRCGTENSANAGDYWDYPEDHVFLCGHCKTPMHLVTNHTVYQEVL